MISIRNFMQDGDRYENLSQALLTAWLELTENIPKASMPANPDLFQTSTARLAELGRKLGDKPNAKAVEQSRQIPIEELEKICRSNKTAIEDADTAVKEVLATAAEAINSLRGRGERHNGNLNRIADEFEALSRIEDISELRRRLKDDVGRLRSSVDEMRQDNQNSLEEFQVQIVTYQRRLDQARQETGVDRLTGLNNRRELERQARLRLAENRSFSLMLFDLDNFHQVNESFGNLAGDNLLKHFADVLRRHVASDSTIFRWGADEFAILILTDELLPALVGKCANIAAAYRVGEYFVVREGRQLPLERSVSFGVAQSIRDEPLEVVYQRARELLDLEKRGH